MSALFSPPKAVEEPGTSAIEEEPPTLPQNKARKKDDDSLSVGSPAEEEAVMHLQEAIQPAGRPVPGVKETLRVKGQKWTPPHRAIEDAVEIAQDARGSARSSV